MTQIDAKILTKKQFQAKKKELENLATSIDVWSATEMSPLKEETIQIMFDDLADNLYALDCAYLEAKLVAYKQIYELMKD